MKDISPEVLKAIETYQVPGCVNDYEEEKEKGLEQDGAGVEWSSHVAGTSMTSPRGLESLYLGMPLPFSRLGESKTPINIFKTWGQKEDVWKYNFTNIPVWKYLDEHGNTLVRGLSPRINRPFLHVILGNHLDKINCYELTKEDINQLN